MRILHIEDDPSLQNAMIRMARIAYGAEVVSVDTCALAIVTLLAAHAGTPFDVVISDWNIKGGTGGEVFEWMLANVPGMKARWMFLTSRDDAGKLGVPHLSKPASNAAICEAINLIVKGV